MFLFCCLRNGSESGAAAPGHPTQDIGSQNVCQHNRSPVSWTALPSQIEFKAKRALFYLVQTKLLFTAGGSPRPRAGGQARTPFCRGRRSTAGGAASPALAATVGFARGPAPVRPADTEYPVMVPDVPGAAGNDNLSAMPRQARPPPPGVWVHRRLCGDPHSMVGGVASR